eukprot:COSAG06_NODE_240_length_19339_cov_16.770582_16_plen_550_part_00
MTTERLISPKKVVNRQPSVQRPSVVEPRKVSLRAISTGSDATDKVLTEAYKPGISQRQYVGAVLAKDGTIRPRVAEDWWKSRRLLVKVRREESESKRGRNQRPKDYLGELSEEQRDALEHLFYGEFRGTVGVRGLWESFNDTNERQQKALQDSDGKKGWISWRDMRAWYNAQELAQLTRNAKPASKTLAHVPTQRELKPFARMQLDSIVMSKKTADGANAGLPDQGMTAIIDLVCNFTRYTFLGAVKRLRQVETAAVVIEFIRAVRLHYGEWPVDTVCFIDGGPEYGKGFRDAVRTEEPRIKFVVNPPANPNAAGVVENNNRVVRGVMRRYTRAHLAQQAGTAKRSESYWYGQGGRTLQQINSLVNSRPVREIGYQSPADVLAAYLADPRTDEDEKIVAEAQKVVLGIAGARRGAAHITPFRVGDQVRVINPYYTKQKGMRSNLLKQRPRWSITRYTIKRVEGDIGDMPRYDLDGDNSNAMYTHDMLILANVSEPVPTDIIARPRTYYLDKQIPPDSDDSDDEGFAFYSSFPLPERGTQLLVDSDSDSD